MTDYKNMFPSQKVVAATPIQAGMPVSLQTTTANIVLAKPAIPANFDTLGQNHCDKLNELSNQVLTKVKTADLGGLGKGITEVLLLTDSVDLNKLNEEPEGAFSKAIGFLKQTKARIKAQYESADTQMGAIAKNLDVEISKMNAEAKGLQTMYDENIKSVHNLQADITTLYGYVTQQKDYVEALKAIDQPTSEQQETLMRENQELDRMLKRMDRLERILQVGIMDAPDIRSLQKNNFDCIGDFKDIIEVTIPLWQRNLAKALIAQQQVKRAELGNAVKDRNNALMRQSADLMHTAGVKTAQLAQRSSVADIDTFEYAQTKLIDRMTQVRQIETNARAQREQDIARLQQRRQELKQEMLKW